MDSEVPWERRPPSSVQRGPGAVAGLGGQASGSSGFPTRPWRGRLLGRGGRGGAWDPPQALSSWPECLCGQRPARRYCDGPRRRSPRAVSSPRSRGDPRATAAGRRRGRNAFLTGEIGSNGTDFRASLQIRSRDIAPQAVLPGALGRGAVFRGRFVRDC